MNKTKSRKTEVNSETEGIVRMLLVALVQSLARSQFAPDFETPARSI